MDIMESLNDVVDWFKNLPLWAWALIIIGIILAAIFCPVLLLLLILGPIDEIIIIIVFGGIILGLYHVFFKKQ